MHFQQISLKFSKLSLWFYNISVEDAMKVKLKLSLCLSKYRVLKTYSSLN